MSTRVREMSRDAACGDRGARIAVARHGRALLIFGSLSRDPRSRLTGIFAAPVTPNFLHDVCVGASKLEPADHTSPQQLEIMDDE